jgi:hypothetical protein
MMEHKSQLPTSFFSLTNKPYSNICFEADDLTYSKMARVCLITGGTQGIGRETAELLVSQGWVVIISGRNVAKGEEVSHNLACSRALQKTNATN